MDDPNLPEDCSEAINCRATHLTHARHSDLVIGCESFKCPGRCLCLCLFLSRFFFDIIPFAILLRCLLLAIPLILTTFNTSFFLFLCYRRAGPGLSCGREVRRCAPQTLGGVLGFLYRNRNAYNRRGGLGSLTSVREQVMMSSSSTSRRFFWSFRKRPNFHRLVDPRSVNCTRHRTGYFGPNAIPAM